MSVHKYPVRANCSPNNVGINFFEFCELMCSMQPKRGKQSKYIKVERVYFESDVKVKEIPG